MTTLFGRSTNDKPYDQFIRGQIAGDEIMPNESEGIVAAGFLRMGPWELTGMEVAKVARMRFLDDVTNSVGETFLGQSLQCCRCHDHKFDPIPTRDYYSVQAVFATTQLSDRFAEFSEKENRSGFDEKTYLEESQKEYEAIRKQMDEVLLSNAKDWFSTNNRNSQAWEVAVAKAKQGKMHRGAFNAARNALMSSGVKQDELPPVNVGYTPQQFGLSRVAGKGLERLNWEFDRYEPFAHSVYNGSWNSHDYIERAHGNFVRGVDQPIAALIKDLKQRSLLDSTLIVWCGEFGRTPDNGVHGGVAYGRDHNPNAMTIWMSGGGCNAGHTIGATDEMGMTAVENIHHVRDFHCTLLRLLGLDDNKLTYHHAGRFKQLSQFGGKVIEDLIA